MTGRKSRNLHCDMATGYCQRCLQWCFAHKNKIPATLRLQLQYAFQVSLEILQVYKHYHIDSDTKSQDILCVSVSQALISLPLLIFQKAQLSEMTFPSLWWWTRVSAFGPTRGHSSPWACGLQAQLFQDIVPASDCYSFNFLLVLLVLQAILQNQQRGG